MFDTHCHLNFQAFEGKLETIIKDAEAVDVNQIVVPGTDLETSKKAVEIAEKFKGVYAAVGIHPHHVFEIYSKSSVSKFFNSSGSPSRLRRQTSQVVKNLTPSLLSKKTVAVGEVGLDRHYYQKTKHEDYKVDEEFVELQKEFLKEQIKLAVKHGKSLILHNREAKHDMLKLLNEVWDKRLEGRAVFHCCEPDEELLEFAKAHKMFIGVDGDVVYWQEKQGFIKKVPLEMLVFETDSPYLSPLRKFPNEPKNIKVIAEFISELKKVSLKEVEEKTTENARKLFNI